jgi:hypothetical protein
MNLIQRAERNSRSLQSELLAIIETAANQEPSLSPSDVFRRLRSLGIATPSEATEIVRTARDPN